MVVIATHSPLFCIVKYKCTMEFRNLKAEPIGFCNMLLQALWVPNRIVSLVAEYSCENM